jgi:hypothetical protein
VLPPPRSVDKYAVLATYDQIAAKDYNLNIGV